MEYQGGVKFLLRNNIFNFISSLFSLYILKSIFFGKIIEMKISFQNNKLYIKPTDY